MWKPNQTGPTSPSTPEPARPAPPASTPAGFEPHAPPWRASSAAIPAGEQATIGKSLVVKGEVSGSESLFIDGKVEGTISLPGNRVTVGRNGQVAANITAREVVVLGKVRGNIRPVTASTSAAKALHRRRRRREHLHRGRRLLQGRHRHPQARRYQERSDSPGCRRARRRRSKSLAASFQSRI